MGVIFHEGRELVQVLYFVLVAVVVLPLLHSVQALSSVLGIDEETLVGV